MTAFRPHLQANDVMKWKKKIKSTTYHKAYFKVWILYAVKKSLVLEEAPCLAVYARLKVLFVYKSVAFFSDLF